MTRRFPSPDFDLQIADWLESDPDEAPGQVLETVLAAFPSLPQRRASRMPWRLPPMTRNALLGAAATIVVLIGVAMVALRPSSVSVAGPSPVPSIVSTPSATVPTPSNGAAVGLFDATFTSTRHGYTVQYPSSWTTSEGTAVWKPGTETLWGDPALDVLQGPRARLVVSSQPLAAGQAPNDWYRAYCQTGAPAGSDCGLFIEKGPVIPIGTARGLVNLDGVPAADGTILPGGPVFDAAVVAGGRGYEFTLDGAVSRSDFDRLMATVTFIPATPKIENLTRRFTSPIYHYTLPIDPTWTVTPATRARTAAETANPYPDEIKVTGTDTVISISSAPLGTWTWPQLLAQFRADATGAVPAGCEGGDSTTWPTIDVGDQRGRIQQLCNAQIVYVLVGTTVWEFDWGNETFTGSQHLEVSDFHEILKGVTFPAS